MIHDFGGNIPRHDTDRILQVGVRNLPIVVWLRDGLVQKYMIQMLMIQISRVIQNNQEQPRRGLSEHEVGVDVGRVSDILRPLHIS